MVASLPFPPRGAAGHEPEPNLLCRQASLGLVTRLGALHDRLECRVRRHGQALEVRVGRQRHQRKDRLALPRQDMGLLPRLTGVLGVRGRGFGQFHGLHSSTSCPGHSSRRRRQLPTKALRMLLAS